MTALCQPHLKGAACEAVCVLQGCDGEEGLGGGARCVM